MVAFGGNALLKRGEPLTTDVQRRNAQAAAAIVAQLVQKEGLKVCVTHGNGPQVGLLALQDPGTTLDVLDAETEGQLGYLLEMELANALGPEQQVVALLTQVEVDENDSAFQHPTKQIGPRYSRQEAEALAKEKGWAVAPDGDAYRRVVASPAPREIMEAPAVELLLAAGMLPVCCGGGGIPVALDAARRRRHGVEAVIDKDAASALLAARIGASWLVMLTDADAVYDPQRWPAERVPLRSPITAGELEVLQFEAGSMKPKVEAAISFVRASGGRAAIGHIADAADILLGRKGTLVVPDDGQGD